MLFFLNYLECCISLSFGSIHFTEVLYSFLSVYLPITANILHPEIFSSVESDSSFNSLIPTTLHTTYVCIKFLPGENLLGSVFPMLFTFILDWFSFPDSLFLCPHSITVLQYLHAQDKWISELTVNRMTVKKGV